MQRQLVLLVLVLLLAVGHLRRRAVLEQLMRARTLLRSIAAIRVLRLLLGRMMMRLGGEVRRRMTVRCVGGLVSALVAHLRRCRRALLPASTITIAPHRDRHWPWRRHGHRQ